VLGIVTGYISEMVLIRDWICYFSKSLLDPKNGMVHCWVKPLNIHVLITPLMDGLCYFFKVSLFL